MVVFHPPSTCSMDLAVRFQAGRVPFLPFLFTRGVPLKRSLAWASQVTCAWTTCHLQYAPAGSCSPTTGHSVSCTASAWRADNLQTQWDIYLDVLSNPFCQQHLILGNSPVNKRGRHEEQLGFLLHFCRRSHIIPCSCWSPGTHSQVKTTDLWVCLS